VYGPYQIKNDSQWRVKKEADLSCQSARGAKQQAGAEERSEVQAATAVHLQQGAGRNHLVRNR